MNYCKAFIYALFMAALITCFIATGHCQQAPLESPGGLQSFIGTTHQYKLTYHGEWVELSCENTGSFNHFLYTPQEEPPTDSEADLVCMAAGLLHDALVVKHLKPYEYPCESTDISSFETHKGAPRHQRQLTCVSAREKR